MGKLDADRRVLSPHESDQRLGAFDLGMVPDAEIVRVDEADLFHRGCLDKDQPKTAQSVAAEMHEVEAGAGVSGLGAIVHHRRHWLDRQSPQASWTTAKATVDQPCMMRCKSVTQARDRRDPAS